MILPQELVDEVLTHLRHDIQALQNCSLVAKSWTYSSQRHLFTRIYITPSTYRPFYGLDVGFQPTFSSCELGAAQFRPKPTSTYRKWQEIASPTSTELLRHTHSLTCYNSQSLHDFHEDYFKSFHRLQFLSLEWIRNIDLDTVNLFPAFQNTLSLLSLFGVSLTLDALIKLLGYFPNLRELYLSPDTFWRKHRRTPPPSTPPRGMLSLSACFGRDADILLQR